LSVYNSPMKPLDAFEFNTFWESSDYADRKYIDEALTAAALADIESEPGFKLPASYVEFANFPLLRLASEL